MKTRNERQVRRFWPCILLSWGALVGSVLCTSPANSAILIDDFTSPQTVAAVTDAVPPTQSTGSSLTPASGVLGNERDLYAEKTLGADGQRFQAQVNVADIALRVTTDVALGRAVITWDGVDGLFAPNQVKYGGLGRLDLTAYSGLQIVVGFSDQGGPVKFTLWDGTAGGIIYATTTFDVPGGIPAGSPVTLTRDFSEFDFEAESITDVLRRVGAIQMEIDATAVAQQGWDLQLDTVRIVPESGSVLCWSILTLAGVVTHRFRRRKA